MPLAELQQSFAAALLDPSRAPPPDVVGPQANTPGRRFDVYRNNVVAGLIEALRVAYPAVDSIVGRAFFDAAARVYVGAHLPASPVLFEYGGSFPEFLETFPPAAPRPYLADVARLEWARVVAFHAADAAPLDPAGLARVAPEVLAGARFRPHPAVRIVCSRFPVVTVWLMNSGGREPAPVDFAKGEDALVTRPALELEVRLLRPGAATFLTALQAGKRLAEAVEIATDKAADFDLGATLGDSLAAGAFCAIIGAEHDDV